jgi:hypothetical protein
VVSFVQANPDPLNPGVLDADGNRLAPTYNHHVDNCLYADVQEHHLLTVAASILALCLLLGEPSANHRDPVSLEKFEAKVTHTRKAKGLYFRPFKRGLSKKSTFLDTTSMPIV